MNVLRIPEDASDIDIVNVDSGSFWHLENVRTLERVISSRTIKMGFHVFLSDPGIPGVRSMGPSVSNKLTHYTLLRLN